MVQDPRAFLAPSSFNGTGTLTQVGASIVAGAREISSGSAASSFDSSSRLETAPGVAEAEQRFASENRRATADQFAHLRRAPVGRDFDHCAEPKAHLPVVGASRLPSWVEFDRKVLRFSGYTREAVHGSQSETWRIRPVLLYFYLEDDSLQVTEPVIGNAGLPQGVIVRRHRVPKTEGEFFTVDDLCVGAELPIYGRKYRLTAADGFTRAFFEQNGAPLDADEDTPLDPFARRTAAAAAPPTHLKPPNPMREHQEAALGKQQHGGIAATQQFLKNDGKVLRFYATWQDGGLYGEKRAFRSVFSFE